jgi:hypothetical protein
MQVMYILVYEDGILDITSQINFVISYIHSHLQIFKSYQYLNMYKFRRLGYLASQYFFDLSGCPITVQ